MESVSPSGVTGNINVGVTTNEDILNEAAENAVQAMGERPNGIYTVDLKEDQTPKVTELNSGRFHRSAYVYSEAGLNLPYYHVKLALDEPVELPRRRNALKDGTLVIRNTDNPQIIMDLDDLKKDLSFP